MAIRKDGKILTARQQKQAVMEWTGWTSKEYQNKYDLLRNRTRAYEKIVGRDKGDINVADLLAREARRQYFAKSTGRVYAPTEIYKRIQSTPAVSSGEKGFARLAKETIERVLEQSFSSNVEALQTLRERGSYVYDYVMEQLPSRLKKEDGDVIEVGTAEYKKIIERLLAEGREKSSINKELQKAAEEKIRLGLLAPEAFIPYRT